MTKAQGLGCGGTEGWKPCGCRALHLSVTHADTRFQHPIVPWALAVFSKGWGGYRQDLAGAGLTGLHLSPRWRARAEPTPRAGAGKAGALIFARDSSRWPLARLVQANRSGNKGVSKNLVFLSPPMPISCESFSRRAVSFSTIKRPSKALLTDGDARSLRQPYGRGERIFRGGLSWLPVGPGEQVQRPPHRLRLGRSP